ncbi:RICIN domain-containing protein [Dactylosporangium sp. CA-092794]|uniref:RICIN domain-containing protein n=1 Tax=Dactylosporangium sp. CA-092794 TaxID=3239929 RepID=UPI003D930EE1
MASVLAVCSAIIAFIGFGIAGASDSEIEGKPIDDATAQTLSLAALSCRDLSGPRLAGQVLAGDMTSSDFKKWAPWPDANANDTQAKYYALAHNMCDLLGQVRASQLGGDVWKEALAAYHDGLARVKSAKGVPSAAQSYVDTVNGYTNWYVKQPPFSGDDGPSAPASNGSSAPQPSQVPVPAEDLPAVLATGGKCPEVTPVKVAAQLMASSAFNPNKRSSLGQMGIAQFSPDVWSQYTKPNDSPWDPGKAIATLGTAMCDLVGQLRGIGGDPYQLALAGFRVGPTPVRQALGVPAAVPGLKRFIAQVNTDIGYYSLDPRLNPAAGSPPVSPAPSGSPKAPASPAPSGGPATEQYKIVSVNSGKLLSPLKHSTELNSQLVQHSDSASKDQLWQIISTGDGHVKIKNVGNGLIVAVLNAAKEPEASLVEYNDEKSINNEWNLVDTGGGVYKIQSAQSGLVMAVDHMSTEDDAKVTQFGDNGSSDHLWRLVPAG